MILHTRIKGIQTPNSRQLSKWAKMTDNNYHYEVRIEIARHFNDEERLDFFTNYLRESERNHYHTNAEGCIYCDVTTGLLTDIYRYFGEEVYKQVKSCL